MTIYVSAATKMTGDGTKLRPFKTIQEAAEAAHPGDTVLVADGVYREHVRPRRSGTAGRPIVFQAVNPRRAVVTGAEILKGWERAEAEGGSDPPVMGLTLWRTVIPGGIFGDFNPFTTRLHGDWIRMEKPLHTGLVFLDDRPLKEVAVRKTRERIRRPASGMRRPWEIPPSSRRISAVSGRMSTGWRSRSEPIASCRRRTGSITSRSVDSLLPKRQRSGHRPRLFRTEQWDRTGQRAGSSRTARSPFPGARA